MRYLRKEWSSLLLLGLASAAFAGPTPIRIEDVVSKVSSDNFEVYADALRVYQAKESIQVARGGLLPKLNLWKVVDLAFDPRAVIGMIEDVAPFLVPANWFRLKETEILYFAEREGYRALWANEVFGAKQLYLRTTLDTALLNQVVAAQKELDDIRVIVQAREVLGGAIPGQSREIEIRSLALQEDQRALRSLLVEEGNLLSYMLGLPASTELSLTAVPFPLFDELKPLNWEDFQFRILDAAPEIRQFNHFIASVDYVRKEMIFSFLGGSSVSRGVAGGVFDHLPSDQGLGFGTPASMRIAGAQKEILKTQEKGLEETLLRRAKLLTTDYNLDLENYKSMKRRVELTSAAKDELYQRLRLGESVDSLQLVEASRNHIQAETAFFALKQRFLVYTDQLNRLLMSGDYTKLPILLESLQRGSP